MAIHLYDDLPTALAKAVARGIWRRIFEAPYLEIGGLVISTPVTFTDADVEDAIRADLQGLGFLWQDDGSEAF